MTSRHFAFASSPKKLVEIVESERVPRTLDSKQLAAVTSGDVIWIIQVVADDDANVLSRFEVVDVKDVGDTVKVASASEPPFMVVSLKTHGIQVEFVNPDGESAGCIDCECCGSLPFKGRDRGFRTGWRFTDKSVLQLERVWVEAHGLSIADSESKAITNDGSSAAVTSYSNDFDPTNLSNERERTMRAITARPGQAEFRYQLLKAHEGRCAITECTVEAVLEAAHIVPYCGPESNDSRNGLLLRGDVHTLFDLRLLRIDPDKLTIVVDRQLHGTEYESLAGRKLRLPENPTLRPSREAFQHRWNESQLQNRRG